MKTILLLLSILLSLPVAAQHAAPKKGDTRIIITLPDSSFTAWQQAARVVTNAGYGMAATSPELLTFTTTSRSIPPKNSVQLSVSGAVQKSSVTLTGRWELPGFTSNSVVYRGMKGSPFMLAWDELERLAKAMGGQVTYAP